MAGERKAKKRKVHPPWLKQLRELVSEKPLVLFRFSEEEWFELEQSYGGLNRFTVAYPRDLFRNVRTPTACLLYSEAGVGYFALLSACHPSTTLQSRVRIERAHRIKPDTEHELLKIVTDRALAAVLRNKLQEDDKAVPLSPKLSDHLIVRLARLPGNRQAMRAAVASIDVPRRYAGNQALQQDAVSTALRAFGIQPHDRASFVDVPADSESALALVNIWEDAVIEDNARNIPGLTLTSSDLTGKAVFLSGGERLEVITANKRPLEQVLGVDLIYLNTIKQNVVMVQYKMLKREREDREADWIFYPDEQLRKEIARMKRFSKAKPPGPLEYRINPQVFFLKLVRRDAMLGRSTITMPLDHYEVMCKDPACRGPKGGFRISFDTLSGRYLRQEPFLDLIRSGYIGAHAETASDLTRLVNTALRNDRAVVAAVQSLDDRDVDD